MVVIVLQSIVNVDLNDVGGTLDEFREGVEDIVAPTSACWSRDTDCTDDLPFIALDWGSDTLESIDVLPFVDRVSTVSDSFQLGFEFLAVGNTLGRCCIETMALDNLADPRGREVCKDRFAVC